MKNCSVNSLVVVMRLGEAKNAVTTNLTYVWMGIRKTLTESNLVLRMFFSIHYVRFNVLSIL